MDKNNKKAAYAYLITALIVPTVFQIVYGNLIDDKKNIGAILLISFFFFLSCFAALALFIGIRTLVLAKKSKSCLEVMRKIDRVANEFIMPDGSHMFDILEQDYALCESVSNKEGKFEKALKNSHHIVYHSTTAKADLNWIEYIFWSFLGRLHNEIGCEVIVSLHYDEKARETGLQNLKERERYNLLFSTYSNVAKKLIGDDITVIDEEDFRKKGVNAQFFAGSFHNKFVRSIVQYAKDISDNKLDFKGFMRKISYIESVFPIMVFSKSKMKKSRIYVLDREIAHEIWSQSPFAEYKNNYGLFFITAQTIKYADGTPVRIFSREDTINITDDITEITSKLSRTDIKMKEVMFCLLKNTSNEFSRFIYNEETIDLLLIQLISEIKSKYQFSN